MRLEESGGPDVPRGEGEGCENVRELLLRLLSLVARDIASRWTSRHDTEAANEANNRRGRPNGAGSENSDHPER